MFAFWKMEMIWKVNDMCGLLIIIPRYCEAHLVRRLEGIDQYVLVNNVDQHVNKTKKTRTLLDEQCTRVINKQANRFPGKNNQRHSETFLNIF